MNLSDVTRTTWYGLSKDLNSETIKRLGLQGGFLLTTYAQNSARTLPAVPRNG